MDCKRQKNSKRISYHRNPLKQTLLSKTMKHTCIICSHNSHSFITKKNGYTIYKCNQCNLYFVHPQPTDKALQKVYSFESGYFEYTPLNKTTFSSDIDNLLQWYKKETNTKQPTVLDVGSGSGTFVYQATKRGFDATGLDLNKDMVQKLQKEGLNIIYTTLEKYNAKPKTFDAINLGDIIEHVKDPHEFLNHCHTLLKKQGKMYICTPNSNTFFVKYQLLLNKIFKIPWGHISPPHHLHEFSDNNLIQLLEQTGFKIKKITYRKIPFSYIIGNIGLFKDFKNQYRKTQSLKKSLFKSSPKTILLLSVITPLYLIGSVIDKTVFKKQGDSMKLYVVKK